MRVNKKYLYLGLLTGAGVLGTIIYFGRKHIYQRFDYKTDLLLLGLTPIFRKKVKKFLFKAKKEGINLRVMAAYRDCEEQNRLYAQGRTKPGKVITNAKCGKSAHNHQRAVDVVEFREGKPLWKNPNWERIGQLGEAQGLKWGGRWKVLKDLPHFEGL